MKDIKISKMGILNLIFNFFNKKQILIFVLFLFILSVSAQDKKEKSKINPSKHKKIAIKNVRYGDVYSAIEHYEKYFLSIKEYNNSDFYHAYQLAELYRKVRDYENAKDWYWKVYKSEKKKYVIARYYYAQMLMRMGNYKDASDNFDKFKREFRGQKDYKLYRRFVRYDIEGCELAKTLIDSPRNVKIRHLNASINKAHIEVSPMFTGENTFIYASMNTNSVPVYHKESEKEKLYLQFYGAKRNNDEWTRSEKLENLVNKKESDVCNGVYSPDKKRFYFTLCKKNSKNENICSIYMKKKKNGEWQSAVKMNKEINKANYTSTQPAVGTEPNRNYEILYFVSDRPGGRGGLDIWYSRYDERDKIWEEPQNAGGRINTRRDEVTPFYDQDAGEIYFSSTGNPGLGGFDIYKSSGYMRRWERPQNIGYPLNSSVDDIYYVLNPKNKAEGLFVSNRNNNNLLENRTCCDDIFYFKFRDYIFLAVEGQVYTQLYSDSLTYMEDIISEEEDSILSIKQLIPGAIVLLFKIDNETKKYNLLKRDTTNQAGEYFFNLEKANDYKLVTSKEQYFTKTKKFTTKGRFISDTLMRNLKISPIPKEPIIIKNIYFPFDESYLTDSAKTIIDTTMFALLKENPQIIVEISSHTDSKGTEKYNEKLSEERAKSVVEYLIEKGISKDRLVAKGYGETQPIAYNQHTDGTDNPKGRQKNRRAEFRVIG
ncbi:MAG: OmpA family protein, partial [Bacteroidota bacterium]|nr:OmpA family protein [Bacteroidota bacterium]